MTDTQILALYVSCYNGAIIGVYQNKDEAFNHLNRIRHKTGIYLCYGVEQFLKLSKTK